MLHNLIDLLLNLPYAPSHCFESFCLTLPLIIHGLKDLINELLGIELDKSSQSSDWGNNDDLTKEQLNYAANDVRYLIEAMHKLKVILERENRYELAQKCFSTVSVHADLDILKFSNIFEH